MKKLYFFMMTTANGLSERGPWEIDWHNTDEEFKNGNVLLTYAPNVG